ncbi:hypothetical protein NPIL_526381, partial [Nephila pilipes]
MSCKGFGLSLHTHHAQNLTFIYVEWQLENIICFVLIGVQNFQRYGPVERVAEACGQEPSVECPCDGLLPGFGWIRGQGGGHLHAAVSEPGRAREQRLCPPQQVGYSKLRGAT